MPRQSDLRFTFEPVQGDAFEVVEFTLKEGLSQPFTLSLELASHDPAVDFNRVSGQPAQSGRHWLWPHPSPLRRRTQCLCLR